MSGTATDRFDEIFSTSLLNYKSSLEDNIFDAFPLFDWMNQKGGRLVEEDNANDIIVPIMYGKNTTVSSYSGYDIIDTTPPEGIGNAKFPMKQIAGAVTINRFSERQNAGKSQIINLFKAKMLQLELSFQDNISEMLYADGTGNESKDITGLAAIVDSTPATGTVGGINAATYSWWRNYQVSGAKSSTAFDNLLAKMRTCYNTISKRKDHPDFGVTTQTVFEGYEGLMTATINFNVGNVGLSNGDLGFENLKYKGMVLSYDEDCNSGSLYMLNSKYLKLHVDKATNFVPLPFQRANNVDARTAMVLWYGELVVSNRERQGVITAIT